MALFGDHKNTHYFKMGVVVRDPSRTYAELCLLYNSLNEANAGVASSAVDMPLSVSEDIHYEKKYFKVPNTTSSSTAVWNAILVCVRVNKTTGDIDCPRLVGRYLQYPCRDEAYGYSQSCRNG